MLNLISFVNDESIDVNGTSLKGYVKTDYTTLVEKFGEPTIEYGDKSTVEWVVEFSVRDDDGEEFEVPATIYDWKTGDTPYGTYSWHIGGHGSEAVDLVDMVLEKGPNNVI